MKLVNIRKITGKILLLSGLHIGAGKDSVEIGGLDNPIIKNPLTNAPYIPGSSLKGKMRSLLEMRLLGEKEFPAMKSSMLKGNPCQCGECPVCKIFGVSGSASKSLENQPGPTRLLVRDALLDEECQKLFEDNELPMEIKYENSINRCTGVANPRPLERVPAGAKFDLNLSLRVYEGDDFKKNLKYVYGALKLLELDALGGGGSRGNGEVRFDELAVIGGDVNLEELDVSWLLGSREA